MKNLVAPSILTVDPQVIPDVCSQLQQAGADWIHCDVMDGKFVPNNSPINAQVVGKISPMVTIPLDVHLMVNEPHRHVLRYLGLGAGVITMHVEALESYSQFQSDYTLQYVRSFGALVGLSIKPNTPVSALEKYRNKFDLVLVMSVEPGLGGQKFIPTALDKIRQVRQLFPNVIIQVDGGINATNAQSVVQAGADVLVAGTAVVGASDYKTAIQNLKFEK